MTSFESEEFIDKIPKYSKVPFSDTDIKKEKKISRYLKINIRVSNNICI